MSDEDYRQLKKSIEVLAKIMPTAKWAIGALIACILACASSVVWVNAKSEAIVRLESDASNSTISRAATLKEWSAWRSDIEKVLAKLSANQEMVIKLQCQQADLIARHLDKS